MNHKQIRIVGIETEARFRKMFKGTEVPNPEADFETKNYLFEVKSANIFNKCKTGNTITETSQIGRFKIDTEMHKKLKTLAESKGKKVRYLFIIR